MLTTDPRVDLVTFTGSDGVGATIMEQAAPSLKRLVLELGGKSPLIVRDDADIDLAASLGAQSITFHAGQGCALTTRHLVHRRVPEFESVSSRCCKRCGSATPPIRGHRSVRSSDRSRSTRTERYVDDARDAGAAVLTGGGRPPQLSKGYFYEPTLLGGAHNDWPVAREEIFGPVAVVIPFDDDDQAVRLANDSDYGLDGHVVSADAGVAFELALPTANRRREHQRRCRVDQPGVPFGGYKRSGFGRENGEVGLDEYTQLKTIKYHAR